MIVFLLGSCTISKTAYDTRKSIKECGCKEDCVLEKAELLDETTYYRLCGRK